MKKEPKFIWDETTGVATCYLNDGKQMFAGIATCAEIDKDMMSKLTGCEIALYRAEIKYYLHLRDNEIKPALSALKHTYACMNHSKQFNSKSYESKTLRREIHRKEFDLNVINIMLAEKKRKLKAYISDKEAFYQKIREGRKDEALA